MFDEYSQAFAQAFKYAPRGAQKIMTDEQQGLLYSHMNVMRDTLLLCPPDKQQAPPAH